MKQKIGSSRVITKTYLNRALDERFGLYDKKMEDRFRRVDDRFKRIDDRFKLSEINTDIKLENLEKKIDEKAQMYRDELLTSNDKLMSKFEMMQEEMTIGFGQLGRAEKQVQDHEKRLKILESA
jgi:cell shape-determining protein MreC